MYLALICVLVFASSGYGENEQEVLGKVNAGIDAGNAIVEVLSDENLSKTFGKIGEIASKIGPFLGAIGPAISLISIFLPSSPSPEMQFMKKKFAEMDQKFDQVFTKFDEVKNLIQKTSLKAQYGEYEHTISALSHRLEQFLSAPTDAVEGQKATFFTEYESSYSGATYKLWRGMMGKTVLSDNIPETAITYTKNNRGRVQRMMKGVTNLIIQGVKIHLFYLKAKGRDATYEVEEKTWKDNIKELIHHMKTVDRKVTNAWRKQSVADLNTKLASLDGKSNSYFADKVYAFLTDKYDWRDWFIVVYNPISGSDGHWVKWCYGHHFLRKHGRNVALSSVDQKKATINRGTALNVLRRVKTKFRGRFFFGYKYYSYGAKKIFNSLPYNFRKGCSPYAAAGVIDKHADIQYRSKFRRRAVKTNGNYQLHAFG
ncbi:uncharacterized protein LOC117115624 isoform X2 [Anneissia japonica]|nr:uncharacterized protein LOC117115624 isoform X2 [Anneissia japonica]XP_033115383.1 uncharacterized protein LOC117115624 isoform X2 [Anneissia japonica]XP_033115384.1 uncharacterized protein LOC117115624 isoform X2 [Anneissia japonica]